MSMWSSRIPNLEVFPVLPVLCGREDGEAEGTQSGEGGADADESQAGNSAGTGEQGSESSEGNPQAKIAAQQEIIARKQAALDAQNAKLEELQKFKDAAENAKLSDKEKIDKRIAELEKSSTAKESTLQKLVIHNTFLASNDIVWHDAETALSLLDTSGFEIVDGENGVPAVKDRKAFKAAIEKLAKDKPYLVKTSTTTDDEDSKPGKPEAWTGSKTGDAPKPEKTKAAADRARLIQKFPALRGRN